MRAAEPIFGHTEEWKAFGERHPLFLERFPNLKAALDVAYIRTLRNSGKLEAMLFSRRVSAWTTSWKYCW